MTKDEHSPDKFIVLITVEDDQEYRREHDKLEENPLPENPLPENREDGPEDVRAPNLEQFTAAENSVDELGRSSSASHPFNEQTSRDSGLRLSATTESSQNLFAALCSRKHRLEDAPVVSIEDYALDDSGISLDQEVASWTQTVSLRRDRSQQWLTDEGRQWPRHLYITNYEEDSYHCGEGTEERPWVIDEPQADGKVVETTVVPTVPSCTVEQKLTPASNLSRWLERGRTRSTTESDCIMLDVESEANEVVFDVQSEDRKTFDTPAAESERNARKCEGEESAQKRNNGRVIFARQLKAKRKKKLLLQSVSSPEDLLSKLNSLRQLQLDQNAPPWSPPDDRHANPSKSQREGCGKLKNGSRKNLFENEAKIFDEDVNCLVHRQKKEGGGQYCDDLLRLRYDASKLRRLSRRPPPLFLIPIKLRLLLMNVGVTDWISEKMRENDWYMVVLSWKETWAFLQRQNAHLKRLCYA